MSGGEAKTEKYTHTDVLKDLGTNIFCLKSLCVGLSGMAMVEWQWSEGSESLRLLLSTAGGWVCRWEEAEPTARNVRSPGHWPLADVGGNPIHDAVQAPTAPTQVTRGRKIRPHQTVTPNSDVLMTESALCHLCMTAQI